MIVSRPSTPSRPFRLWAAALCLALALPGMGCVKSAPTSFYLLDSGQPPPATGPLPGRTLRLGAVTVPEYLDRRDMVLRHARDARLEVAGLHQWAEPLAKGVHRVLREVLAPRLAGSGYSLLPDGDAGEEAPALLVDLLRLDGDFQDGSCLIARWQLRDALGGVVAQGVFSDVQPGGPDFAALARDQGLLVRRLGVHLADQLDAALPGLSRGDRGRR